MTDTCLSPHPPSPEASSDDTDASLSDQESPASAGHTDIGGSPSGPRRVTGLLGGLLQIRAIVLKSLTYQSRQTISNAYQIIHPLLCLFILWLISQRMSLVRDIPLNSRVTGELPIFLNLPALLDRSSTVNPLMASDCNRHFVVRADPTLSLDETEIREILHNPFAEYCPAINQFVPFIEFTTSDISSFLFSRLEHVDDSPMVSSNKPGRWKTKTGRGLAPDISKLPDGGFYFHRLDKSTVSATLHINDLLFMMYHRENGFSLLTFRIPEFSLESIRKLAQETLGSASKASEKTQDWASFFYKHVLKPTHNSNQTWFEEGVSKFKDSLTNATSQLQKKKSPQITTVAPTEAAITMIDTIFKNHLQKHHPNLKVVSGVTYMETLSVKNLFMAMIYCNLGVAIVAMALVGSFGAFVAALVTEREEKTLYLMRVHGTSLWFYLSTTYLIFLTISLVLYGLVVCLCRYWLGLPVFMETSPAVLAVYGLLFSHSQVGTAFWAQSFTKSTKMASIFSVIFSISSVSISVFMNALFATPLKVAWFLYALPHFDLVRVLSKISLDTLYDRPVKSFDQLSGEAVEFAIAAAIFSTLYLVLGWRNLLKGQGEPPLKAGIIPISERKTQPAAAEHLLVEKLVKEGGEKSQALVLQDLYKAFQRRNGEPFLALQGVSLHIKKGEVFGLLGPNGAGKSTLINIVTGLTQSDSGRVSVAGRDITQGDSGVSSQMGICPQFDCLWPDLTVEEHFLFYARMRGYTPWGEEQVVAELIRKMRLESHCQKRASQLSGGMRRRVSIGIATCGASSLIILDEPTSGLDPVNRTGIWRILKKLSGQSTVLLTTHLMEEADSLCDRIGIINRGQLLCADLPLKLKQAIGSGLVLSLAFKEGEGRERALGVVRKYDLAPHIVAQRACSLTLRVRISPSDSISLSRELERDKEILGLQSWSLTHAGLHDVFINAVQPEESRASLTLPSRKDRGTPANQTH